MDLTFQVPLQYCSSQHWTLLPSPVTSTAGCCFCFSSIPSFFLELFLHWSPVACWAPTSLGSSSYRVLFFAFSYCLWGSQGKNTEVVCHSLPQWTRFCQNAPPWPICLGFSIKGEWINKMYFNVSIIYLTEYYSAYKNKRNSDTFHNMDELWKY